ncbi:thioester-forming surface-anchored protein [Arcanobacterium hippocoleae]
MAGSYSAAFYLGQEGTKERYIAYCYNKKREAPARKVDDTIYYEKTQGTAAEYGKSLSKPIDDKAKQDQLIKDLRRVLYHGYPNDASKLSNQFDGKDFVKDVQKDGFFREVTQWVVWHYTDQFNPEDYYEKEFALADQDAKKANELKVAVYKKLIENTLQQPGNEFGMDLFTTTQTAKESGNQYQNILVTKVNHPAPEPPKDQFGREDPIYITKVGVENGKIEPNALTGAELKIFAGEGISGSPLSVDLSMYPETPLAFAGAMFDLGKYGKRFGDVFTLVESEAPNGYKKTDPIVFTVAGEDKLNGESGF